jgi:PTS system fructose-specific IIC component
MKKFFQKASNHLMVGISVIIPLMLGSTLGKYVTQLIGSMLGINVASGTATGFLGVALTNMYSLFNTGLSLINPILGAFIAFSIGGKSSAAIAFLAASYANSTGQGFIGAVIAAFVAGYVTVWSQKHIKLPGTFAMVGAMIITPLISAVVTALVVAGIMSQPLTALNNGLMNWLMALSTGGTSKVILAIVVGVMISSDLGGPINKACLMACIALMSQGVTLPLIFMLGAMPIPTLGYALATTIRKNKFSEFFQGNGVGCWAMGIVGLTEGAIPFTLINPLKLIPVNIIGTALGCVVIALTNVGMKDVLPSVPGVLVSLFLKNGWGYLLGLAVGALFIAVFSTMLVDFTTAGNEEVETNEEDIEISFE